MVATAMPSPSAIQITGVIGDCLNHCAYSDALLLAELYHDKKKCDESLELLCDCLMRAGRTNEVYALLMPDAKTSPRLRYLFAKVCYDTNRVEEACRSLCDGSSVRSQLHSIFNGSPSSPFAAALLATIMCETGRAERAADMCAAGVEKNPFIWSLVSRYIELNGQQVATVFEPMQNRLCPGEDLSLLTKEMEVDEEDAAVAAAAAASISEDVVQMTPQNVIAPPPAIKPAAPRKTLRSSMAATETPEMRRSSRLFAHSQDSENVALRGGRLFKGTGKMQQLRSTTRINENSAVSPRGGGVAPRTTRSRDTRQQPLGNSKENAPRSLSGSSTSISSVASMGTPNMQQLPPTPADVKSAAEAEKTLNAKAAAALVDPATKEVFVCVRRLADVQLSMRQFNWAKALEQLNSLPWPISSHALSVEMKGRVLFEVRDYVAVRDVLGALRKSHPHRVEGMEMLSSALWHLQERHALSALASELTRTARHRPQSWCVAGNAFSLEKQHACAVEALERAIRLDPRFVYAFTLLGHELLETENSDKAAQSFRSALALAPLDYRAWYGLGLVHYRKEQMSLAQVNLSKAVSLNPTNATMLCQLALVEQALGRAERALQLLDRGRQVQPSNVAVRFHRCNVLFSTKRNQECLAELNELKSLSPDEAQIYYLLGRVHRRLGDTHTALLNFAWATEMDPRGEQNCGQSSGEENYDEEVYSPA